MGSHLSTAHMSTPTRIPFKREDTTICLPIQQKPIDRDFPYWESSGSKGSPIEIMA